MGNKGVTKIVGKWGECAHLAFLKIQSRMGIGAKNNLNVLVSNMENIYIYMNTYRQIDRHGFSKCVAVTKSI